MRWMVPPSRFLVPLRFIAAVCLASLSGSTGAHTLTCDHAQRLTQDTGTSQAFNGITVKNRFNAVFGRDQLKLEITAQSTIQHDFGYDTYGRLSTAGSGLYVATYGYLSSSDLLQTTTSKNNGVTKLSVQRNWEFGTRLQAIANTAITNISWDTYTFHPVNRRARTTAVDGSAWQYDYNERGELRSARRFWTDFSPVAGQQFDFTYDNVGNRGTQSEGGDANGLNLRQTSYTPNALNQYTTVNPPNAVDIIGIATATATVTVNGTTAYRKGEYYCQPLSVTNSSAPVTLPVTVTTTQGSSITQTGIVVVAKSVTNPSYDLDGNLTDDGFWTYTWDAENRLIQMESVSTIGEAAKRKLVFTYDHAGRRATKKVYLWSGGSWSGTPSTDLKLVHDGRRLLAELNPTGNAPLRSYVWGQDHSGTFEGAGGIGGLVLQTHHGGSATNFFPAYDGNGNVTALVHAADQSIAARYEYSAFGETLRATEPLAKANPIRFSTKCTDDETGLVCFGARYYHSDFGRWAGRDPLGMVDGPNVYAFVGNRPTYAYDAWGLDDFWSDAGEWWMDTMYGLGSWAFHVYENALRAQGRSQLDIMAQLHDYKNYYDFNREWALEHDYPLTAGDLNSVKDIADIAANAMEIELQALLSIGTGGLGATSGGLALSGRTTTAKVNIPWGKGIKDQGGAWEDYLAAQMSPHSRLPKGFDAFDFFDESSGLASSAKTLDTSTASRIANPAQLYSQLKRYIDKLEDFSGAASGRREVTPEMITVKQLRVAVPETTTSAQWEQINRAIEYGNRAGVRVIVTPVE